MTEREPGESASIRIMVSEEIQPGSFMMVFDDEIFSGSLTDLTDSLVLCGLIKKHNGDKNPSQLVVNRQDWEERKEFIINEN